MKCFGSSSILGLDATIRVIIAGAIHVFLMGNMLLAADPVPVALWQFNEEEASGLKHHGGVQRDLPGPRPPTYPDFMENNTAVKLDGSGAYLSMKDEGVNSKFDFTNGDTITLEAWIQIESLPKGGHSYVIGKGRTRNKGFASDNQNWAFRIAEKNGKGTINFLFASAPRKGEKSDAHWHRWTSKTGFNAGPAWHHIAVSYKFGDAKSIRGWIDGKKVTGTWDMGGETSDAPVVDDDSIWIGSSMGGAASASLRGSIDNVAVYREAISDEAMARRFRLVGSEPEYKLSPEVPPQLGSLPANQVLLTFHEGMPAYNRWLRENEVLPAETLRWQTDAFVLDRMPQRYDAIGIRQNWKTSVLVSMATDVALPAGQYRLLMRTRGLSRLWVNDSVVARSGKVNGSPSGEEPITPPAAPPLPGHRIAEHRQQENFADFIVENGKATRIILETLVGGTNFRTDPGETLVAIKGENGKSFVLVQPDLASAPALTDAGVLGTLARQEIKMKVFDDERRRAASISADEFWQKRHEAARAWVKLQPAPAWTSMPEKSVDAFLQAKIQKALTASAKTSLEDARQFHRDVLPILQDNCFRCHGEKDNGGLRLLTVELARKGGDSGLPAVHPGEPGKSELISRIKSTDPNERMPPGPAGLKPEQIQILENWIQAGALWPAPPVTPEEVAPPPALADAAYLRRVYLDTVGVIPTEEDVRSFLEDSAPDKRFRVINKLLADERWADHWMAYWQDILAENPTLINASLNTTGPFRWFLIDSLRDGKPLDRMITELISLRGSPHEGGSAGFGIAANNDAPFAAKGQIVASAFLGIELQCARCHDSPYHSTKQKDLYALAAMFERKAVTVPESSRVPLEFFEKKQRESLIHVTLKPNEPIEPVWPFAEVTGSSDDDQLSMLLENPADKRERLAGLITSPSNSRFAQVMVNRIWRKFIGTGIVEPPSDWEGHAPSHPEMLEWLAQELITHDYDVKHVTRLIMHSDLYQREAFGDHRGTSPDVKFFVAPDQRRMSAEQLVDSLHHAGGQVMDSEELTFDPDGRRQSSNRLTLGIPTRAWMYASLANERDRPSLNLPRARAVTDILEAFGWSGSRQNPRTDRESSPNVLQPGVLANSASSVLLTRVNSNSGLAELGLNAKSPEHLVDSIFLRYLGRFPTDAERDPLVVELSEGFDQRFVPADKLAELKVPELLPVVTWSNHLRQESNSIALELEERARAGMPPDPRLDPTWREVYEDVIWSVVNLGEFVWIP